MQTVSTILPRHVDVLIVGAGLSGIGAAYHLQSMCPDKTYVILEARERLGGTWDLFRYPGIRSDSDMYTLGYSFRPWTNPKAIADGPSILEYIRETAQLYRIDEKIHYQQRVVSASWSSEEERWTVVVHGGATGEEKIITCNFLFACAGYYDYDRGYTPEFPGRDRFRGPIVHPQKWTDDIDYADKRVIVIGSGATAVTLVPAMSDDAAHVTMLQRSPTYVMSLPERDPVSGFFREHLPEELAYQLTRWKNVLVSMGFYQYCRRFPKHARGLIIRQVQKLLGGALDVDPHFTPSYDPWDQRLCFVPDADLFEAIRDGKVSVVTGQIQTFTEKGIRLQSGEELEADLIVTATGLKVKLIGGIELEVDGRRVAPSETLVYKGTMLSEVPNFAFAVGYTNASWTLKCELSAQYFCRLLQYMDRHGYTVCRPRKPASPGEQPVLDLKSGYILRVLEDLPRQGARPPWRLYQNYVLDRLWLRRLPVPDRVLEFSTPTSTGKRRSWRPFIIRRAASDRTG